MPSENIPDKNAEESLNSLTQGGVVFAGEGGQTPDKGTETW